MPQAKYLKEKYGKLSLLLLTAISLAVFTFVQLINKPKDLSLNKAVLAGDCEGNDGDVDILDFQALSNTFAKTVGQSGYNAACNFNSDPMIEILDYQLLSNNFGRSGVTNTPTISLRPTGPTPTTGSGIGPINLSYKQGGIWLTPSEIAQIPTNNPGWTTMTTWANKPMDIVASLPCTAGGASCNSDTTRVMFARAIVGMRTNNQTMINSVKAELDRVPEAVRKWTEVTPNTDIKWGERNIPLIAVTANILDYRPSALKDALTKVVRQVIWPEGHTIEASALWGLANKPSHGRWGLMSVAYLTEDFATVNKVVKAEAKFMSERNWGGTVNDHKFKLSSLGTSDGWQTLQPGGESDPIGIMPTGIMWNGHGVGGLYLADQYRAGNGPVWVPQYTNYTYEGLGPNLSVAFAADHLGYQNVFALGNYAVLRTLLFHYSTHDGKPSWPAQGNDTWEVAAVMTWAKRVFGSSLPSNLKPEPDAPVPWPLPLDPSGGPGRSMGFMYATHYARLAQ